MRSSYDYASEYRPCQSCANHCQRFSALLKVHGAIDAHNLERKIYHLVLLRASQINGCGYCVEMHTKEAREDGETNARLDRLVVWEHVDDFTPRERAAFAWTEALTRRTPYRVWPTARGIARVLFRGRNQRANRKYHYDKSVE